MQQLTLGCSSSMLGAFDASLASLEKWPSWTMVLRTMDLCTMDPWAMNLWTMDHGTMDYGPLD